MYRISRASFLPAITFPLAAHSTITFLPQEIGTQIFGNFGLRTARLVGEACLLPPPCCGLPPILPNAWNLGERKIKVKCGGQGREKGRRPVQVCSLDAESHWVLHLENIYQEVAEEDPRRIFISFPGVPL